MRAAVAMCALSAALFTARSNRPSGAATRPNRPARRAKNSAMSSRLSSIVLLKIADVSANSRITRIVRKMFVATTSGLNVN